MYSVLRVIRNKWNLRLESKSIGVEIFVTFFFAPPFVLYPPARSENVSRPYDARTRIRNNNVVVCSLKGMSPSYASPQGIEPSFDISHERIKGEHNREKMRKKLSKQESTATPSEARSTPSSDKHVVVSVRYYYYYYYYYYTSEIKLFFSFFHFYFLFFIIKI